MAINDAAGEMVYHEWDILREFLGHNFVFSLRTLKSKKKIKTWNLSRKPIGLSSPDLGLSLAFFPLNFLCNCSKASEPLEPVNEYRRTYNEPHFTT